MARYRKKPVEVEAFLFGVDNMPDWFMDKVTSNDVVLHRIPFDEARARNYGQMWCDIKTLEGTMRAYEGKDYIIKGIKGEIYPCTADIFEATYETTTADVVPKSEVERLNAVMKEMDEQRAYTINMLGESLETAKSEIEMLQGSLKAEEQHNELTMEIAQKALANAKSEVAREIFEEIEREVNDALQSNYRVLPQIEESEALWNRVGGKIDALRGIEGFVVELKKKYTGQIG